MPELRKDPIIGRWVIISTERGKRPHDFVVEPEVVKGGFCPFDPGNEHTTPPEVLAYREPGTEPNTPRLATPGGEQQIPGPGQRGGVGPPG